MSYTEINTGKLREVDLNGLAYDKWAQKECEKLGIESREGFDSCIEALNEYWDGKINIDAYGKYVVSEDDRLFEILENKKTGATEDISILMPNPDGTYSYIMQFYNGGCCLSEALGYELAKLPKK